MLKKAVFRLARIARDESALEQLLNRAERIDVNAKDRISKTALMYAEVSANKRMVEFLKKTNTVE